MLSKSTLTERIRSFVSVGGKETAIMTGKNIRDGDTQIQLSESSRHLHSSDPYPKSEKSTEEQFSQKRQQIIDEWSHSLALLIAKARFGPGIDMGGKHNPLPSENKIAKMFVYDFVSYLEREYIETHE